MAVDDRRSIVSGSLDPVSVEVPGASSSGMDETDAVGVVSDELVAELAVLARAQASTQGLRLLGEGGLLQALTKRLLEDALESELAEHLALGAGDGEDGGLADPSAAGSAGGGNGRNGHRERTVLTEVGPVSVRVPRDRAGTFTPAVLPKGARRLPGLDDMVISLTARGMSSGDIVAHLRESFDVKTTKETVSQITDQVLEGMAEWRSRPLDPVYPVVFIDCIYVKVRDGQVANRPVYVALAVDVEGRRDILGLWLGSGGEGASGWQQVLLELQNRGVRDVLILVCDGLKGLPEAVGNVFPDTVVQTCVVHLQRQSLRYAARKDWSALTRDLRAVLTSATEEAARGRLKEAENTWGATYPSVFRMWQRSWAEISPFYRFGGHTRAMLSTTNVIESLNARYRRAVSASGHFPNDTAALKRVYLATIALDPTGKGRARWISRWKPVLNELDMAFEGRLTTQTDASE